MTRHLGNGEIDLVYVYKRTAVVLHEVLILDRSKISYSKTFLVSLSFVRQQNFLR